MVITDFDPLRVTIVPNKAYPPLLVDSDTPLPFSVSPQGFQPVVGWNTQILNTSGVVDHAQFAARYRLDLHRQFFRELAFPYLVRFLVVERRNHAPNAIDKRKYCQVAKRAPIAKGYIHCSF